VSENKWSILCLFEPEPEALTYTTRSQNDDRALRKNIHS